MMNSTKLIQTISSLLCFVLCYSAFSQQALREEDYKGYNSRFGTIVRGQNALVAGLGASLPNGDLSNPEAEIYSHIGYKRFLSPHINVNVGFHKFNIAYKDVYNEGFMSFDMNLEFHLLPYNGFNFFVFGGGGINASNYFKSTGYKVQGGSGFELLITESVGFIVAGELNKMFSDDLDGLVSGDADDLYWRASFGVNFYFGKRSRKKKIKKGVPTVINSNPIIHQ